VGKERTVATGQSNHMPRGATHLQSKGGIRQNPDRDQSGTRSQGVRPAQQFAAPEEKGGLGDMAAFAVRPDCLTATRVPSNNLPPLRFQPYAPLAPHHALSLRFRKTTRLTTTTRRVFAGRTHSLPRVRGKQIKTKQKNQLSCIFQTNWCS